MSPKKIALPLDIYVRVSDVRGRAGDSFISPKDQEERCRALGKARALRIGEVLTDLDVSGGKMRRPELDRAIARIESGESGGIIVAKLDRFARTLIGGLQTLEQIDNLGGAVIVADGEFDTSTATGELVLNMMLSLAQFELRRIRETWVTSKRSAVDRGIHVTRHVPPGYVRGKDRRLVVAPRHGRAVLKAFKMAAKGEPYARIAAYLTEKHVPSGDNAAPVWQANRIKRLLANRVYLGEARNGHGDVNTTAHEALVDELTWNLAQRASRPGITESAGTLLAGLCRCASCSFAMRSQSARKSTVAVYRCTTNTTHGRCAAPSTISLTRLEDYVIEQFVDQAGGFQVPRPPVEDEDEYGAAIVEAERSYRGALIDLDLRAQIGEADHSRLVAEAHRKWQDLLANAPAPTPKPILAGVDVAALVERLRREDNVHDLRELLGSAIEAVFVRPAMSRSHSLPVADRVKVVFRGEEEALELPRRGESYEPRAYVW
ncbi:MAG TPA: recombinase family protein [Gaiellaceae bacterium]|nr:recombinase family protein [Gaiellaceae bacterium]